MSEKRFKEAKGQLAFSQSLVDKFRGQNNPQQDNMAQPSPQMEAPQPPQDVVQPTPQAAAQPVQTPPDATGSESPVDLLAKSGESMQNAFRQITQAFSKTEEKKAQETQDLEKKFTTEIKGLKENIRKIVEE